MAMAQSMDTGQSEGASPGHGSPAQASVGVAGVVDVSDDEENEAQLKLKEHELRELQKINSIKCIELMRIPPKEASRFDILLCRMVPMPLVRPTLLSDVKRLEAEFSYGYRPGASMFYVSLCDENGKERTVTTKD
jgi:hypothetical protein